MLFIFNKACATEYKNGNCQSVIDGFIAKRVQGQTGERIFRNGQIELDTTNPNGHITVVNGTVYTTSS